MKLLTLFYPRAWRERYGAEFEALLRDEGVTLGRAFDIARVGILLRWEGWRLSASRDLSGGIDAFRELRPLYKFIFVVAWLTAFISAAKGRDLTIGAGFLALVGSVTGLNLLSQARDDRSGSRARRTIALLLFTALSIDAWIYVASWGSVRAAASRWVMQPLVMAIIPQTRPWPGADRSWSLRLGTIFCALQLIGFWVGLATGRFGLPPVVICGSIISALAVMLERERRSVVSNAAAS